MVARNTKKRAEFTTLESASDSAHGIKLDK